LALPPSAWAQSILPGELFCEFITFITEPQTGTMSFYVADLTAGTLTPDSVVFKAQSGAISIADTAGLTYRTLANQLRVAAGFMIVNDQAFNLAQDEDLREGIRFLILNMAQDPDLLRIPTLMGAGGLIGYNMVVQQSGLQPGGGLSITDLADGASIAQQSLVLLQADPNADKLKDAKFMKAVAAWGTKVLTKATATTNNITTKDEMCLAAADTQLKVAKCVAQTMRRQGNLSIAIGACNGQCEAVASEDEATATAAEKACDALLAAAEK